MLKLFSLTALAIATAMLGACNAVRTPPKASETRYLYYLHGKVVEDSGPRGVSPRFGAYDYPGMIAALGKPGIHVLSEVRPRNTDPSAYADKIVAQIRAQLAAGVRPSRITVAGASKGSVIASLVSTRLKVPGVRFVLMANCNDWLIRTHDPRLTGDVLSIYEASDDIGGTCESLVKRSPGIGRFREIRLETGLGHGVIYRPLPLWVEPTLAWANS